MNSLAQGCQGPAKSKIRTARAGEIFFSKNPHGPGRHGRAGEKIWAGRAGENNLGRQGRRND